MVNGVFTIPLVGVSAGSSGACEASTHRWGEFVAGSENVLAAQALWPFLDGTPTEYNPLVLYGPHGSGKSHLAVGLADWWRRHFPDARVLCMTAAQYAEAYNDALTRQQLDAWREQVRGADLLVIEDLGQLAAKRGVQLELLHALDALADRGALVVVTARSLPTHSPVLLAALRSRLSAGLAVPLALPGRAARRAVLERVLLDRGLALPKGSVRALVEGLPVSVPELVAAALELELSANVASKAIESATVKKFIRQRELARMPAVRDIARLTAKYFGLKLSDLKSPERRQPLVAARGVAMHLARQLTDQSLEQIGAFFGGRDHTTVMHALDRTEKLLRRDRATRQAIAALKAQLVAS